MEIIKSMNELRTYLHTNIYNTDTISLLIEYINRDIDVVSVQGIDESRKVVLLKIKKMNMKRLPSYNNDVLFYYNIFNKGFILFIQNILSYIQDNNIKNIIESLLQNPQNVNLLYNINVIDDSNIFFYL